MFLTDKLEETKVFYRDKLDFEVVFDLDSYLQVRYGQGEVAPDLCFMRPDAFLAVVIVSATDDASPGSVASYMDALKALKTPALLLFGIVTHSKHARLGAFQEQFPLRATSVSIDDDWTEAFIQIAEVGPAPLASPCFGAEPIDSDPLRPGLESSCVVVLEARDRLPAEIVPQCQMLAANHPRPDTVLPCWWAELDELQCVDGVRTNIEMEIGAKSREATLHCDCTG